jgi:hypothetical protein
VTGPFRVAGLSWDRDGDLALRRVARLQPLSSYPGKTYFE